MQKFLWSIALLIGISCGTAPERNCSDFKTGTFQFTTAIEGKEQTTTFTRKARIEIEELNGKRDTASIRWINDCEYILQKLRPRNRNEEKSIHIKILVTTDSSYTFEYNAVGDKRKFKGEAFKIN